MTSTHAGRTGEGTTTGAPSRIPCRQGNAGARRESQTLRRAAGRCRDDQGIAALEDCMKRSTPRSDYSRRCRHQQTKHSTGARRHHMDITSASAKMGGETVPRVHQDAGRPRSRCSEMNRGGTRRPRQRLGWDRSLPAGQAKIGELIRQSAGAASTAAGWPLHRPDPDIAAAFTKAVRGTSPRADALRARHRGRC